MRLTLMQNDFAAFLKVCGTTIKYGSGGSAHPEYRLTNVLTQFFMKLKNSNFTHFFLISLGWILLL